MCCFQDVLNNCMPYSMLDPYGDMPLAGGMTASVDITIQESDGVTRIQSVKTPPKNGILRLPDILQNIMGPQMASPCDQGKCEEEKEPECDTIEATSSPASKKQGSQPWADGKSPESPSRQGATEEKDAKEKAPK